MSCCRNEVVLLPIPFTDLTSRKVRPAVVIGGSGPDVFVVPISSQLQNTAWALNDWRAAGLNVPCGIKAQIATIEEKLIVKRVGMIGVVDRQCLTDQIRAWLQL